MRTLSGTDCLEIWERGARLHALDRGLLALGAALPETPSEGLADWPLGRRNRALAEARCLWFGSDLAGWVECPACGEKMEFRLDARALTSGDAAADAGAMIAFQGHRFRVPTSRDLALAAREKDPRAAAVRILELCRAAQEGPAPCWSDEDLEEAGERLALADPMAENRLELDCSACGHRWEETLDITDFLWSELEAGARRLLTEVHELATAYGWSEREILSLSDARRRAYLEMVRE